MPVDALRRRGVVRRLEREAGKQRRGAVSVVFAVTGCAGCGWGAGAAKTLRVATNLPEGTVVEVAVRPRRLLGQAARAFAPPLAAALGAAAIFGDGAWGGLAAVLGLFAGMGVAIASGQMSGIRRAIPAIVAAVRPAHPPVGESIAVER